LEKRGQKENKSQKNCLNNRRLPSTLTYAYARGKTTIKKAVDKQESPHYSSEISIFK